MGIVEDMVRRFQRGEKGVLVPPAAASTQPPFTTGLTYPTVINTTPSQTWMLSPNPTQAPSLPALYPKAPRLVGLTGLPGTGKTLVSHMISTSFRHVMLSDMMKGVTASVEGDFSDHDFLDGDEVDAEVIGGKTWRELFEDRRDYFLKLDPDFWINIWRSTIPTSLDDSNYYYVVDNVRSADECRAIKLEGGIIFRVVRPEVDFNFPLSDEFMGVVWDGMIVNTGSQEDLAKRVVEKMEDIGFTQQPEPSLSEETADEVKKKVQAYVAQQSAQQAAAQSAPSAQVNNPAAAALYQQAAALNREFDLPF